MNRFCIVLAVLFSINLTTSDFVSADDRAHRNGIKSYRDAMQKLQEQKKRSPATDDLFKQAIKSLEAALKGIKAPRPKAVVHLYLGISKYEYRRGSKKEAAESLKSALENDWLDTEQRADAHLYLAMSLLALGEKTAQKNFEKAFRQNPNIDFPSWRRDDTGTVKEFDKVQKTVTGILTITISPPETENWSILIDGKKLSGQNRNAVVSQDGLRLYKGEYSVQGIYKGEPREETVTIEPNRPKSLGLKIPPLTVEHEPPSSADAGQEIPLTIYVSRNKPRQVNIYYRKTSEWRFTLESPDDPPVPSADRWTYTVNLPSQNFVGEIEYYIEAEYTDLPPVTHPENDYHQTSIVDKTRPKIKAVTTNPSIAQVNQLIEIIAEVEDNISVKEVHVHFSPFNRLEPSEEARLELSEEASSDTYTVDVEVNKPGNFQYHLTATDEAGNESRYPQTGELKITVVELLDTTPPTIRLIEPHDGATFKINQSITIRAKVTDDTSVKEVHVHFSSSNRLELSEEASSGIYTVDVEVNKLGNFQYHLTATDEAGKQGESEKRSLKIVELLDTTPPTIRLIEPHDGATFKINQSITIRAKVTDDTSVKEVHVHFSSSNRLELSEEASSGIYTVDVEVNKLGNFQYHLTATDEAGKQGESEKRSLEIVELLEDQSNGSPPEDEQLSDEKQEITVAEEPEGHEYPIWINYTLSNDFFKDGPSAFDWGRGSLLGIAYLREGKNCWTFGGHVDFPDWTNKVSNPILTGQLGYSFEKFGLALLGRGRISDNSTYSLGGSLKYYPVDRVTIDFIGSINLQSVRDARTNGASISDLLDTKHLDHYEVGIRFPIYRRFNMRVGFGGWHLDRNITGVQIGFGYTL